MLHAVLNRRLGAFTLDVQLTIDAGRTLVMVGESGAGKTTVLRLLAGLVSPDQSVVTLDGISYSGPGIPNVPAWHRDIGYVPQDYSLFPHLTAAENVAFGLRASHRAPGDIDTLVATALERFSIAPFAAQRPHELSGGQQQRVALARALVLEPKLLLLDEPLAALDRKTREALRGELQNMLRVHTGATIFVTHSEEDARAFGDDVFVIDAGRRIE